MSSPPKVLIIAIAAGLIGLAGILWVTLGTGKKHRGAVEGEEKIASPDMVEAESRARRELELDEAACGKSHPEVAIDLSYLAALLQASDRIGEAEPLMRRALEICEESLGSEHPGTVQARKNLEILRKEMAK